MIVLYVIPFKINTTLSLIITCLSLVRSDHHQSISKQRKKILQNNLQKLKTNLKIPVDCFKFS